MTRIIGALIAILALASGASVSAGEGSDDADMDMLEFLGSWEAEDEDWLAVSIEDVELEQERAEDARNQDAEGVEAADDER
jgi:hypothetical protein